LGKQEYVSAEIGLWIMPSSAPRVLLVEDTDELRRLYSRVLQRHGFEVREASNGEEALARLGEQEPDLVLTDIMMPVLDGIELIRQIRANPAMDRMPVVAVTASAAGEIEQLARDVGAMDVLFKPVELPALLSCVAAYCG
jgi:chemosensory pili system protein ChpA (sensor histidine kinase/response regulator)